MPRWLSSPFWSLTRQHGQLRHSPVQCHLVKKGVLQRSLLRRIGLSHLYVNFSSLIVLTVSYAGYAVMIAPNITAQKPTARAPALT